jgi:hypothetical protein
MVPRIPAPEWVSLPEAVTLVAPPLDPDEVWTALLCALADGKLQDRPVYGISSSSDAWRRRHEAGAVDRKTGEIRTVAPSRLGGQLIAVSDRPQVRRQDVLDFFQVAANKPRKETALVSAAKLAAHYRERVKNWPSDQNPPSEEDDRKYLEVEFPRITREQVRAVRREYAPDAWKARGRRPSKNSPRKSAEK